MSTWKADMMIEQMYKTSYRAAAKTEDNASSGGSSRLMSVLGGVKQRVAQATGMTEEQQQEKRAKKEIENKERQEKKDRDAATRARLDAERNQLGAAAPLDYGKKCFNFPLQIVKSGNVSNMRAYEAIMMSFMATFNDKLKVVALLNELERMKLHDTPFFEKFYQLGRHFQNNVSVTPLHWFDYNHILAFVKQFESLSSLGEQLAAGHAEYNKKAVQVQANIEKLRENFYRLSMESAVFKELRFGKDRECKTTIPTEGCTGIVQLLTLAERDDYFSQVANDPEFQKKYKVMAKARDEAGTLSAQMTQKIHDLTAELKDMRSEYDAQSTAMDKAMIEVLAQSEAFSKLGTLIAAAYKFMKEIQMDPLRPYADQLQEMKDGRWGSIVKATKGVMGSRFGWYKYWEDTKFEENFQNVRHDTFEGAFTDEACVRDIKFRLEDGKMSAVKTAFATLVKHDYPEEDPLYDTATKADISVENLLKAFTEYASKGAPSDRKITRKTQAFKLLRILDNAMNPPGSDPRVDKQGNFTDGIVNFFVLPEKANATAPEQDPLLIKALAKEPEIETALANFRFKAAILTKGGASVSKAAETLKEDAAADGSAAEKAAAATVAADITGGGATAATAATAERADD